MPVTTVQPAAPHSRVGEPRLDRSVMADVPVVPILALATTVPRNHSPRVRNLVYLPHIQFLGITNIWLDPDWPEPTEPDPG